jgi:8-oxo-dGTP pyrophosphatase MutT (NUDIX family)
MRAHDAATLVVYRHGRQGLEILMGRRANRHRFVPGHYVFPGGRVDPSDYRCPVLNPLRPEIEARLGRIARALAVAAARETYEETGLVLGRVQSGVLLPALGTLEYILRAITPTSSPIRFHARFFAVREKDLAGELRGNGELLDLQWRGIAECLRLPIVDVTDHLLRRLAERPDITTPAQVPLFSFRGGIARVTVRKRTSPAG